MSGIEALVVLAVASFHLAIVSGGKRSDQLVFYTMFPKLKLENGGFIRTAMGTETLGKFLTVVCLDTFNGARKGFNEMIQKQCRGMGAVFFKSLHETPSGILINSSVLIKMISFGFLYKADRRDKFHVDLDALSGMVHLFIRFWNILWVRRMNRHKSLFSEEAVKAGDGAGIATLHELYPEDNKTCIGIASAHIRDKFDFLRSVLVRMVMGTSGKLP